jgi:hypothetical protein
VCQCVYTEKALEPFNVHEENPVAMNCDCGSGITEDSVGSHVSYREAVGNLVPNMGTCPDTAFVMSRAAQAMNRPAGPDWVDVTPIFKCLWGTRTMVYYMVLVTAS